MHLGASSTERFRGDAIPDSTKPVQMQAAVGCLPGRHASFSHHKAPLYACCKIFCVNQGLLDGETLLRSCLSSAHRHGDALKL